MAALGKMIRLVRGLVHGEVAYTGPFYVDMDVTARCNMHCLGCQYRFSKTMGPSVDDRASADISLELVERLCEELPGLGTREVLLTGEGEPLLHPRLFDIISAFKRAGCRVHLFTNGSLINQSNARSILDSGLDILKVSLWANSPEEYQECHPGVDAEDLQRTLDGVKIVTSLKAQQRTELPTVTLTQVLNRYNYTSVDTRVSLAHAMGCDGVRFRIFRDWRGEFASASLSSEQINILCEDLIRAKMRLESLSLGHNIDEALLRYRLGNAIWSELPCYVGWFHARIRVDGTIRPCSASLLPLGDLNESSLEEIWNGAAYRAFRRKTSTPKGLASLGQYCDCNWCGLVKDNLRVHQFAKWFAPFCLAR